MVKTIISISGDTYHAAEDTETFIDQVIALLDEPILHERMAIQDLAQGLARQPDLVILSTENQQVSGQGDSQAWLTPALSDAITDYVAHGGSWLALHSGMSNYPVNSSYIQMLKGYFVMHPEPRMVTYQSELMALPCQFMIEDEHYQVSLVDNYTTIFLKSYSDFGESIAGWRHFYGSGKVAGYVPAHGLSAMLEPQNVQLFKTVVTWLLRHQSSVRWKQYLKA